MVEGAVVGVEKDPRFFAALRMTEEAAAGCFLRNAGYTKVSLQGQGTDDAGWLRAALWRGEARKRILEIVPGSLRPLLRAMTLLPLRAASASGCRACIAAVRSRRRARCRRRLYSMRRRRRRR